MKTYAKNATARMAKRNTGAVLDRFCAVSFSNSPRAIMRTTTISAPVASGGSNHTMPSTAAIRTTPDSTRVSNYRPTVTGCDDTAP